MTELFINGLKLELGNEVVSQTHQINDLAEIENRQCSYTNSFKIPPTPNNMAAFNMLGTPGNTSRVPYSKLTAKLLVDGLEIISKGYPTIKTFDGYYGIYIYFGIKDLVYALGEKTFADLDLSDLIHDVTLASFQNSFANTSGYFHALVNNGKSITNNKFSIEYCPGAIFVSTLWDKIFKDVGFEYSGAIFNKSKFKKLVVVPNQGYEVTTPSPSSSTNLGTASSDSIYESGTDGQVFIEQFFEFSGFQTNMFDINDPNNNIDKIVNYSTGLLQDYEPTNSTDYIPVQAGEKYTFSSNYMWMWYNSSKVKISGSYYGVTPQHTLTAPTGAAYLIMSVLNEDWNDLTMFKGESIPNVILDDTYTEFTFNYSGYCKLAIFPSIDLVNVGGYVTSLIKFYINDSNLFSIGSTDTSIILYVETGDTLKVELFVSGLGEGSWSVNSYCDISFNLETYTSLNIDYNSIMPVIKQNSFLKDIMQHFGLLFRQNRNNEFEFIELEELLTDRANAEDWSDKFVSYAEEYSIGSYAQNNVFAYKYDEENTDFANGILVADNELLEQTKTLFTSIFNATAEIETLNFIGDYQVKLYQANLWLINTEGETTTYDPIKDKGYRIFEVAKHDVEVIIKNDFCENGLKVSNDVPFLDFEPCHWQNYIDRDYASFKKLLDSQKKVPALMNLDAVDIYNLDFFRLKYIKQLGKYFYLNKVANFVSGKLTKCELIEIPSDVI